MKCKHQAVLHTAFSMIEILASAAKAAISANSLSSTSAKLAEFDATGCPDQSLIAIRDAIFVAACATHSSSADDKRQEKASSSVYFLRREDGLIKIGHAHDVSRRRKQLAGPCGSRLTLLGAMKGGVGKETELHKRFGVFRERGEWFRPSLELLEFIERNTSSKS
jgi:hypothetical protein